MLPDWSGHHDLRLPPWVCFAPRRPDVQRCVDKSLSDELQRHLKQIKVKIIIVIMVRSSYIANHCFLFVGLYELLLPRQLLTSVSSNDHVPDFVIFADVDECDLSFCGEHGTCTNTLGSFACTCHPGFLPGRGGICVGRSLSLTKLTNELSLTAKALSLSLPIWIRKNYWKRDVGNV